MVPLQWYLHMVGWCTIGDSTAQVSLQPQAQIGPTSSAKHMSSRQSLKSQPFMLSGITSCACKPVGQDKALQEARNEKQSHEQKFDKLQGAGDAHPCLSRDGCSKHVLP